MIFEKVEEKGTLPSTSAIPPQTFIEIFKKEIEQGNRVIYIGGGSGISSTYRNSWLAKQELDSNDIFVIDSQNLSNGVALLLIKARQYINEGKTAEEVVELVSQHINKLSVKFSVDIMDYLYKGGRCSGAKYLLGKFLHIHPIIKVIDNKLEVAAKPRGVYKKALDLQINEFLEDLPNIDDFCLFITHSCKESDGDYQYVYEKVSEHFPADRIIINEAGGTICSHCGPRSFGILYILK
jgi:DegV family protein with EDD domain